MTDTQRVTDEILGLVCPRIERARSRDEYDDSAENISANLALDLRDARALTQSQAATIAALKQEVERLTVDNDALTTTMDDCVQERLDEMSVEAADFDKDVWRALCSYLKDRKGFSWHDYEDGIHAEDVIEFLRGCDEAAESSLAEKDAQLQAKEAVIAEQHRQLNYFRSSLAASRAVVEAARAHFKDAVVMLYEHGGGRVYRIDEKGSRDLIIDLYEPAERRDAILAALTAAPPADVKEDR